MDSAGNVYVSDDWNYEIRKITPSGVVTTLAGSAGQSGSSNGTASAARFGDPWGLAMDSAGNVYVADSGNDEIREISPSGVVTTLAGSAGQTGSSNGADSAARFDDPTGVAVDSEGNVYVADSGNDEIREITTSGVVVTLAGSAGQTGSSNGAGSAARFDDPTGVAVDSAGNVYVADEGNSEIREIFPSGEVATPAGSAGQTGSSDGTGSAARFDAPQGVAVDSAGNVYVADTGNNEIRQASGGNLGIVGGDTAAFTESFDTRNAGTGKTLTAAGSVNDGNGGNNYAVTFVTNTTGQITAEAITVTAATATKGYDGTTSSTATPTITAGSLVSGDTAAFTESFTTKNAGSGQTLAAAGSVNDGNSGNNYTVTFVTNTTGQITAEAITVTAATATKGYDGTTSSPAVPTFTSGSLASGDTAAFSDTFDTKNVGMGKTLTPAGSVADGNSGNNYAVTFVANTAGQITARAITLTAATATKVYDGTTSSTAMPTITAGSLASGDTAAFTDTFDTRNVGTGKTLTAAGSVSDGNSGNNYAVTFVATTGQITARAITVAAATSTKVYDGTTSSVALPTITSDSLATGDTAAFIETFDTKNVGAGKTLTVVGSVNDGNGGGNYAVTCVANTAGSVTPLTIIVSAAAATKVYDGTTSSTTAPTITPVNAVTTLAGSATQTGSSNGTGSAASFNSPPGVAVDSAGNVYVADEQNDEIRKISPSGVVTTLAGSAGQQGSSNGSGSAARFDLPFGVAVDSEGNVYVADAYNDEIRKISPSGVVTTLAGSPGQQGSGNGTGSAASFYHPEGVAVDSAGNVYVADFANQEIREISPSGVVTTLAGSAGLAGSSNGAGNAARFDYPFGVAVDSAGNVYVADRSNDEIRKITPSGVVTTLAGSAGLAGSSNGSGSAARFNYPMGVAVDSAGNVYVADRNNDEIRKISPAGVVTTLAGSAGLAGSSNGAGSAASFYYPEGVAVDSAGNVYVADYGNSEIRLVSNNPGLVSGDTPAFTRDLQYQERGHGRDAHAGRFGQRRQRRRQLRGDVREQHHGRDRPGGVDDHGGGQHQDLRRHDHRRGDAHGERFAGRRHGDGPGRGLRRRQRGDGQDPARHRLHGQRRQLGRQLRDFAGGRRHGRDRQGQRHDPGHALQRDLRRRSAHGDGYGHGRAGRKPQRPEPQRDDAQQRRNLHGRLDVHRRDGQLRQRRRHGQRPHRPGPADRHGRRREQDVRRHYDRHGGPFRQPRFGRQPDGQLYPGQLRQRRPGNEPAGERRRHRRQRARRGQLRPAKHHGQHHGKRLSIGSRDRRRRCRLDHERNVDEFYRPRLCQRRGPGHAGHVRQRHGDGHVDVQRFGPQPVLQGGNDLDEEREPGHQRPVHDQRRTIDFDAAGGGQPATIAGGREHQQSDRRHHVLAGAGRVRAGDGYAGGHAFQ